MVLEERACGAVATTSDARVLIRFVEGFWDKDQAQGKGKATMGSIIVETYKSARDQGDPQARGGTAQEAGSGNGGEHLTPPGAHNTAARQAMPATSAETQNSLSAAAKETEAPPPYQEPKLEHKSTPISSFLRGKLGDFGKTRSLSRSIRRHQA